MKTSYERLDLREVNVIASVIASRQTLDITGLLSHIYSVFPFKNYHDLTISKEMKTYIENMVNKMVTNMRNLKRVVVNTEMDLNFPHLMKEYDSNMKVLENNSDQILDKLKEMQVGVDP